MTKKPSEGQERVLFTFQRLQATDATLPAGVARIYDVTLMRAGNVKGHDLTIPDEVLRGAVTKFEGTGALFDHAS